MLSVTAYHGTTDLFRDSINSNGFKISTRRASWLGYGIYFFYRAPFRAHRWGKMVAQRKGGRSIVAEVELDLADNINLLDDTYWSLLKTAYANVPEDIGQVGPNYRYDAAFDGKAKVGWNYRDCAAVNAFAQVLEDECGIKAKSIIAAFSEGEPIGPDSWLFDESHVVICVRDPAVIQVKRWYSYT